jgi:cytochrome b subunit of formate dehydrogenase
MIKNDLEMMKSLRKCLKLKKKYYPGMTILNGGLHAKFWAYRASGVVVGVKYTGFRLRQIII